MKESKIFHKKLKFKRYFILDHVAQRLKIYKTNENTSKFKLHDYSEILDVQVAVLDKNVIHPRWSYQFTMSTSQREYVLYAASQDELKLWTHTIGWIVSRNYVIHDE